MEFTPPTKDIKSAFAQYGHLVSGRSEKTPTKQRAEEFDRWLRAEREQQARFWMRVTREYHWLWTGGTATNGYGRADVDGRNQAAHRVAYEWLVGPIPTGLELDHLCGVRNCVNPAHLEPVTHKENIARGDTITSRASAKTHCPRGHELAGQNLVPSSLRKGRRDCLTCSRQRARDYRNRRKTDD